VHVRQGDETSAVLRPTLENGKIGQRKIGAVVDLMDSFLTLRFADLFRTRMQQMNSLLE
jgi:hypothetical protein